MKLLNSIYFQPGALPVASASYLYKCTSWLQQIHKDDIWV